MIAGCKKDDPACRIAGSYTLTSIRDSKNPGDCPPDSSDPETFQITQDANAHYAIEIPGVMKGTCPATVDGCSLEFACGLYDKAGGLVGSLSASWMFSSSSFEGNSTSELKAGAAPAIPNGCKAHYQDTATLN